MDSLSLDNFRQQQDYQRTLLAPSRKKQHKKRHKHRSHKHRSSRHHRHRSRKSKNYGSVTDQCAVCLDDETELDTRLFPCKHVFHGECLIEWVKQGESFTCPLCRQEITHFFNLSSNKEINDQLIAIWNDYYVNIDSLESSTADDKTDKLVDDNLISKGLTAVVTAGETEQQDSFKALEEIAKLKNKEINEGLGIIEEQTTTTQGGTIIMKVLPKKNVFETQQNPVAVDQSRAIVVSGLEETPCETIELPIMSTIQEPMQERDTNETVSKPKTTDSITTAKTDRNMEKIAHVWQSMCSTMKKAKIESTEDTTAMIKVLLPSNGIASMMFEEDVKQSLATNLSSLKSSLSMNPTLKFEVEHEMQRINESQTRVIRSEEQQEISDRRLDHSKQTLERNSADGGSLYAHILRKISPQYQNELVQDTSTNMEAGIYAGIAASLVTYAFNHNQRRMLPQLLRGSLFPTMKQNVPNVAAFFTVYEHFKSYVFGCNYSYNDKNSKSHFVNFGERFISAGIASSVAFLPRNQALNSLGLKIALPLRFATFFGSFEFCKDMTSEFKFLDGSIYNGGNSLNLFEIAACAAVGSVVASGVHYPVTQYIQHGGSMLQPGNVIAGTSAGTLVNLNKTAAIETMYRGWMSQLAKFVPTTVACSCAFEFGKRAVSQRKD